MLVSYRPIPTRTCAVAASAFALLLAVAPASAQTQNAQPPSTQSLETNGNCNSANTAEAATPPNRQAADGTSPGNIGSTGWTGGTGGAHMGTNPQGAVPESKTWQPPTARGLDLTMAMPADAPAATSAKAGTGC